MELVVSEFGGLTDVLSRRTPRLLTLLSDETGGRGWGGGGQLSGKRCGVTNRATDCDIDEKAGRDRQRCRYLTVPHRPFFLSTLTTVLSFSFLWVQSNWPFNV